MKKIVLSAILAIGIIACPVYAQEAMKEESRQQDNTATNIKSDRDLFLDEFEKNICEVIKRGDQMLTGEGTEQAYIDYMQDMEPKVREVQVRSAFTEEENKRAWELQLQLSEAAGKYAMHFREKKQEME